ncbi:unnamed protein product [Prorocentrum cordatum]|uniref:Mre11 DNA-binding domain-containing protein n=1 Tax=Prorocentrum cordatum TaxID=2364126 RepID=A0ABN9PL62_9DINO|nr:unnamed protein product [Polarella glacialis]
MMVRVTIPTMCLGMSIQISRMISLAPRLRVEHTGFDTLSGQSFGQQFADRVANPEDILLFHKRAGAAGAVGNRLFGMGDVLEIDAGPEDNEDGVKIQDIIYKHIDGGQSLQILTEPDLNDAVQAFVHRADPCAIERYVRQAVESANQAVLKDSRAADENEIRVQIQDRTEGLRQRRLATAAAGGAPEAPAPAGSPPAESAAKVEQIEAEDLDAGAAAVSFAAEAARPAAADRGRSGRGRGRGRGRGAEKRELPDGLEAVAPPAKAARGRGMPATPAAAHTGRVDSLRLVVGSQGRHQRDAVPAEAPAADQAAATAAPAAAPATGFLQKRGGAAAESVWGNPDAADPGSAARDSQPRANRKWQLRGSDAG